MTDMEKVISDVISAFDEWEDNRCCPGEDWSDVHQSKDMVIALLKAQEPVESTKPDEDNMVYCGACGAPVGYEVLEPSGMDYIRYNYCQNCGRAVKWK